MDDIDELFGVGSSAGKDSPPAERYLSRLEVEGEESVLYTLCSYDGSGLCVKVSDGEGVGWQGELNQRRLQLMAGEVKMTNQDYVAETLRALTRKDIGVETFIYQIKRPSSSEMELVWKKHLRDNNVRFQLGSIILHKKKSLLFSELMDYAIHSLAHLNQENSELRTDNARLASERQTLINRVEKFSNVKEQVEKELYSKFVLVLNDKKAKIRRLMEQLSHEQHQPTLPIREETPTGRSDNETDDEMDSTSPNPSDILLVDHASSSSSPPVKRRKRDAGSKVKGQPVEIPRPPSITRGASSGRQQKMRAISSGSESKPDSLESDQLLDLL